MKPAVLKGSNIDGIRKTTAHAAKAAVATVEQAVICGTRALLKQLERDTRTEPAQTTTSPAYLLQYSLRDPLTQLPNRASFIHRLDAAIELSNRSRDSRFALLYLDIDRFKTMNESLGHGLGDQFLAEVADRIRHLLGPHDTAARLGGDEFAIIVSASGVRHGTEVARELADDIHNELARPLILGRREVYGSASIGIAVGSPHYRKCEEPLRDAELAMYRAKTLGGGRYKVFDAELEVLARERVELEMDLRHALERRQFELHYQPIVSAETGTLSAFEALLRWRHPSRGLLSPAGFLPLLHETSLIMPVGRWVVSEVCRQIAEWQNEFGRAIPMSFNLSAREFTNPEVISAIQRALRESGVNASAITVEITEDALVGHGDTPDEAVATLSATGMKLLIDDFGTGYSSLSYLANLSAHGLKIPREMIAQLGQRPQNRAVVQAIVALAHVLDLEVIAEGVETIEQLGELRELGCEHIQGYLIARPVDAAAARSMIATGWKFTALTDMSRDVDPAQLDLISERMRA